jgi:transposase
MSYRRLPTMDIHELLRLLRAGETERSIRQLLGYNRRTIRRYQAWAKAEGLLSGPLPDAATLQQRLTQTLPAVPPPQQTSTVAAFRAEIVALRQQGLEVAAIRARLAERHGEPISYSAVWRLVQHLEPSTPETFVRVEVPPGSEAQVDFGDAGLFLDPTTGALRKAWVFVLVLSHSRHLYAELVFDQRVETWLLCHVHAFAAFGGVPARVVLDNLKAAILQASVHQPLVQRAYRECAEHYGFLIDPNPPRMPHLKGKVESGVHYVKRNFLAGREREALDPANVALRHWTTAVAGERVHGTTKQQPLVTFRNLEQAALRPLPATAYDLAVWQQATLHRDCHVVFGGSYYSAPCRLVGQRLWLRAGARTVQLYDATHQLVATHDRATQSGQRKTILAHLPPAKVPGLTLRRETCQAQADTIGPATAAIVRTLLASRPLDRLPTAGRIVQLAERYPAVRVEHACARAEYFGDTDYRVIRRILAEGRETEPLPTTGGAVAAAAGPAPAVHRSFTFVRQASDFVASLFGGAK